MAGAPKMPRVKRRRQAPPAIDMEPGAHADGHVREDRDHSAARRLNTADGKTTEWKSEALRAYQRRTRAADALIAGAYLSGTNTRRVRRALVAVFRRGQQGHGEPGVAQGAGRLGGMERRSLAEEPIVRLILDGTVVRVRLDKKATAISLLVVLGVREDGQKVLLAVQNMGGETQEAWRAVLDDLVKRGLRKPALLIVDGGAGLDAALTALWGDVPTQRCTVHKHRNLLAHAPERLHEEITADYTDMIYAESPEEVQKRRQAFLRKWRLRHRAVADSLKRIASSLSPRCRRANGRAHEPPMPSNACTKSSNAASKPRPCCHPPTRQPCCSGRCWHRDRSSCAKSMAGKPLPTNLPLSSSAD